MKTLITREETHYKKEKLIFSPTCLALRNKTDQSSLKSLLFAFLHDL